MRVNDFRPHRDSLFRGGSDLYAGATYTRVYTVSGKFRDLGGRVEKKVKGSSEVDWWGSDC